MSRPLLKCVSLWGMTVYGCTSTAAAHLFLCAAATKRRHDISYIHNLTIMEI